MSRDTNGKNYPVLWLEQLTTLLTQTYNYEKYILLIEFTKNKNNYRIDIFEEEK